jgi:hypothetical protein
MAQRKWADRTGPPKFQGPLLLHLHGPAAAKRLNRAASCCRPTAQENRTHNPQLHVEVVMNVKFDSSPRSLVPFLEATVKHTAESPTPSTALR